MSVTGDSKDYAAISRQLDTALDYVGKAKGTKDPTRKDHLGEADNILRTIGEELLSSKEVIEGHGSILKVLEKYNHVLKKYDEVKAYADSNEGVVPGKPLEKVKLFFNKVLYTKLGAETEKGLFDAASDLLDGKIKVKEGESKKTVHVNRKQVEEDYKELYANFLKTGKVDQEALDKCKKDLALLHQGLDDYGVSGKTTPGKPTSFQQLTPEETGKYWPGAGALRRKLVLELAKVTSLEARLVALENAKAPEGIPKFETNAETVKTLPAKSIEVTVRELRTALAQAKESGVSREQIGRMELALHQYTEAFNAKLTKLVKLDQKFSVGESIGKDSKQIDEAIALAQAKFFTFNEPHDPQVGVYLGKLTAYLVLNADQKGNGERLAEIRQRLETDLQSPSDEAMKDFEKGFQSLLEDRAKFYQSGSEGLERVISKLVATYDDATTSEKTLIGNFLDNKVMLLPANTTPAVVMMRFTSALQAPSDTKLRDNTTGVLLKLAVRTSFKGTDKTSTLALLSYLGNPESKEVEAFHEALVKRAVEDLRGADQEGLLVFRQALAKVQSNIPVFITEETENKLNAALGLGVKEHLAAAFAKKDPQNVEKALTFAANFSNDFLAVNVKGLEAPPVLITKLKGLLGAAPEPTDVKRAPGNYEALEKELQLAQALFPDNSEIKELSEGLKAKQEALDKELASLFSWSGAQDLSTRLTQKKADVASIQGEMQKAIDGALVRKDSGELLRIEADLEKMSTMSSLAPHQQVIKGLLNALKAAVENDRDLSFNRIERLVGTELPKPSSGSVDSVRKGDVREFLIVEEGQKGLPDNFVEVRNEIAECLLGSRQKLSPEVTTKLIQYSESCGKEGKEIAQARAIKILKEFGSTKPDDRGARLSLGKSTTRPFIISAEVWDQKYSATAVEGQRERLSKLIPGANLQTIEEQVEVAPSAGLLAVKPAFTKVVEPLLDAAKKEGNEVHIQVLEAVKKELAYLGDIEGIIAELEKIESPPESLLQVINAAKENLELHRVAVRSLTGDGQTPLTQNELNKRFGKYLTDGSFEKNLTHDAQLSKAIMSLKKDPAMLAKFNEMKLSPINVNLFVQGQPQSFANSLNVPTNQLMFMRVIFMALIMEEVKNNPQLNGEFNSTLAPNIDQRAKDDAKEKFVKGLATREQSVADASIAAHLVGFKAIQKLILGA